MNSAQIQTILRGAGWPESLVLTMTAIALAESGGNPNSHNPVPPDDSYGLWQINMLGRLGPARRAQFGLTSNNDLYNPATNARVALGIYRQQGLRAWSTYTNGAYRKFLQNTASTTPPEAAAVIPSTPIDSNPSDVYLDSAIASSGNETVKIALIAAAGIGVLWLLANR